MPESMEGTGGVADPVQLSEPIARIGETAPVVDIPSELHGVLHDGQLLPSPKEQFVMIGQDREEAQQYADAAARVTRLKHIGYFDGLSLDEQKRLMVAVILGEETIKLRTIVMTRARQFGRFMLSHMY